MKSQFNFTNFFLLFREKDWMWFRGDRVEILRGKDKGKIGLIISVIQERNWVLVEGLNCKHEIQGEDGDFPGYMIKVEEPLLVTTDIKLVDPSDDKSCDVTWQYTEDGTRVRTSARTGTIIPIPTTSYETIDYRYEHSVEISTFFCTQILREINVRDFSNLKN